MPCETPVTHSSLLTRTSDILAGLGIGHTMSRDGTTLTLRGKYSGKINLVAPTWDEFVAGVSGSDRGFIWANLVRNLRGY